MKSKTASTNNQEVKEKISLKTILIWVGIYVLIFLVCLLGSMFCVRAFNNSYRYYPVSGTSMQPTINPDVVYGGPEDQQVQDGVFVKVTTNVERNDIVIIKKKTEKSDTIIKRVIAKGGDKIALVLNNFGTNADGVYHPFIIKAGSDTIEMLQEDYCNKVDLSRWVGTLGRHPVRANSVLFNDAWSGFSYEKLFYDKFFLTDDGSRNPNVQSILYRYEDKLGDEDVISERYMLFYEVPEDEFFYLGDHRSVSADARSNGCAKYDDLVGRVISIIKNAKTLDSEGKLWWIKIQTIFSYYWSNIVDYFAW